MFKFAGNPALEKYRFYIPISKKQKRRREA
jgi:hypothetical protein